MDEPQQVSLEQYIAIKRNEIVLSYDKAKELALRNFDDLAGKLGNLIEAAQKEKALKDTTPPPKPVDKKK